MVSGKPVRGVIFGPDCPPPRTATGDAVAGYFRPTPALIQTLEARLRPALAHGRTQPETLSRLPADAEQRAEASWGIQGAATAILEHYVEYRRQYAGIVVDGGAERVFVNSFPEVEPTRADDFHDWRVRWIIDDVDDGGPEFWRVEYDIKSGQFLGFEINPSG